MAKQRHLQNAPIREAVIDLQVMPVARLDAVEDLWATEIAGFGRQSDIFRATIGFDFESGNARATESNKQRIGRRFDSPDGHHVLQCRTNGFTFSRLPPYENWETMRSCAYELWGRYSQVVRPEVISRIAVRYINALTLPVPATGLEEFLTSCPKIPDGLGQQLANFLQRVTLIDENQQNVAVVTQAFDGSISSSSVENQISVLVDIDAFRAVELSADDDQAIWQILDELRDFKNRIFFEHLTEKAVELFA